MTREHLWAREASRQRPSRGPFWPASFCTKQCSAVLVGRHDARHRITVTTTALLLRRHHAHYRAPAPPLVPNRGATFPLRLSARSGRLDVTAVTCLTISFNRALRPLLWDRLPALCVCVCDYREKMSQRYHRDLSELELRCA